MTQTRISPTHVETFKKDQFQLMENRVVLVTGASRGIGAATAKLLAQHGAAVGVNYYSNEVAAQQVVEAIQSEGGRAIAVKADVRDNQQVESIVQQVTETFGFLDTLVINAPFAFPFAPFLESRWEDFESKVISELKAAFYATKAVLSSMVEHKRGCIIAVSTSLSRNPSEGYSMHSTAKSGLDALMKSLALELGPYGIRVNVIAPGLTLTDSVAFLPQETIDAFAQMVPLRRNALPEDIAGAILLLASEKSQFISGAYLPVSGGFQII